MKNKKQIDETFKVGVGYERGMGLERKATEIVGDCWGGGELWLSRWRETGKEKCKHGHERLVVDLG